MAQGNRFFLYTQHLSGTGHFVRIFELARALAERNDVYLVDGGRLVPRQNSTIPIKKLVLPRIYRSHEGIASVEPGRGIDDVMKERRALLLEVVEQARPNILFIRTLSFQ